MTPSNSPPVASVLNVIAAIASAIAAGAAVWVAHEALHAQDKGLALERESAAPLLIPGTPSDARGTSIRVATTYGSVSKRADALLAQSQADQLIVPMRNAGAGAALAVGVPLIVGNCGSEAAALAQAGKERFIGRPGTAALGPGDSGQTIFRIPVSSRRRSVAGTTKRLPWNYDYPSLARTPSKVHPVYTNLLVWYTDLARDKLRWTCVEYRLVISRDRDQQSEWINIAQNYGEAPTPSYMTLTASN